MKKSIDIVWAISLFVLGAASIVLAGSRIIGADIPDALTIALGVVDLIALPVMSFTTIKKVAKSKESK